MGLGSRPPGRRVLADLDLKPRLVRGWLNRPDDPDFFERAADVCGLYLDRPRNALVLSVDEKTAIAARSRTHPSKRAAPGQIERREFEYKRHGTACLMAALDVHSGQVLGSDADKTTRRTSSASWRSSTAQSTRAFRSTWCWTTAPRTCPND